MELGTQVYIVCPGICARDDGGKTAGVAMDGSVCATQVFPRPQVVRHWTDIRVLRKFATREQPLVDPNTRSTMGLGADDVDLLPIGMPALLWECCLLRT